MSSTAEIAADLVALCKENRNEEAIARHYSPDIVSIEAAGDPKATRGIDGVHGKMQWWRSAVTVHTHDVHGPWVHDDHFIARFVIDATIDGQRMPMDELALYRVHDGKIVEERFFNAS
jgi:ketosteroid isomerase-like protein